MQNYKLANMIERKRGTTALFPIIHESAGLQRSYLAVLRRFLKDAAKLIRDIIIPSYKRHKILTTDTDESDFNSFDGILQALLRVAKGLVEGLLRTEAKRHTAAFNEIAKKTFSVDLKGIIDDEQLEDYLAAVALRNAGLIKGFGDEIAKKVRTTTMNSLIHGSTTAQLQAQLKKLLGVSDSRARLIARDQTAKLNAELTKKRHLQAGLTKYIWRTSRDERVRDRHEKIDGKSFTYGEKTPAEEGLEPGQPIQCRCFAQAIVEF